MKKIVILSCLLLVIVSAQAQVDRTKAPKPAPAREIKIGEYQTFTLKNGLQVFVVENHKLPRIQVSLQLKNDPIYQGEKEGYVEMAGTLIGTGTKTKTKAQLDEEVDFIGANLSTGSNGIFASSLSKHTTKLLDLMTDVLYNPAFAPEEMEKLKTQTLSGLAASKDNPNAIAGNVRRALVYGKQHPYGLFTTEKSVGSITLEDCKNYYNTYFKPNNAYLIIVGDIDLKTAKSLSEKYFAKWTQGEVKNPTYAQPKEPAKTYVALVDRPASVQSVINIAYPVDLKPGTQDAIKARVTNQILGGGFSARLMQNLREKHGFTYGASSQLNADQLVGNFVASASVRNEVTDSSVFEFMSELKRMVIEPVTEKELVAAKAEISGAFGRSLENPQTIANFALNTAKYNLPKDYYNNYVKSIDAVTLADVQATAKKFIRPENAHIVIVGKGADVADKLKPFGEVKYFDIYGEPYVPAKVSALPADLTAEKVIANYLLAIGGEKKINELKSIRTTAKGSIQGMEVSMVSSKKAGGKYLMELSVAGMGAMQKIVSDGKDISQEMRGQKMPLDAALKELSSFESQIVPEVGLASMKVKAILKSIENVDGNEAYVIDYTFPSGGRISTYFDSKSNFKIQTVTYVNTPQGEVAVPVQYQDYKEVNGVKFPQIIVQSMGPMKLKFETTSTEPNVALDDALFKVQ
ncbi:MAG: insulinase family protein [Cyclobacteriaceae bacterium]|nr:insulinase family protein [Cyclobacteriaceae bacterium]